MWRYLFVALGVLMPAKAHAMATITVPAGSYVVPAGEIRTDLRIRLLDPLGSVVLEPGSTLAHSRVECVPANHQAHGVLPGDGTSLIAVDVEGCGGDGVHIEGRTGVRYWKGHILDSKGAAVRVVNSAEVELFILWANTSPGGLAVEASSGVQIVGSLVHGGAGIAVDAASVNCQIIRSRARLGASTILAGPGTLVVQSVVDGNPDVNQGDRDAFTPRWHTAGTLASFQGSSPDFLSPQAALAAMAPGERLVVDTNKTLGWGDLVVEQAGVLVVGQGGRRNGWSGAMKGNYNYIAFLASLTVTAPGVTVINFVVTGPEPQIQPDTTLALVD